MAKYQSICSIDGCGNTAYIRGFCNAHYLRWRRYGSPTAGAVSKGEPLRWLKKAIQSNTSKCIEWPYASNGNGYGWAWYKSKRIGSHRLALVLATGENPKNKVAAHLCHNRNCVNPKHLSWESQSGNILQTTRGPGMRTIKLNLAKARHIKNCDISTKDLAEQYGVCISTIQKVRAGLIWNE